MAELIHMRPEGRFLRGRNVDRSVVAAIRNHLKKANFQSFDNLLHAFKFYDKVRYDTVPISSVYTWSLCSAATEQCPGMIARIKVRPYVRYIHYFSDNVHDLLQFTVLL